MSTRSLVGVLVAVVLALAGCADDGDGRAPSASTTVLAGDSGEYAARRTVAWVDALPIGPPPAIGYVIGHTYHSPDGRIVQLPRDRGVTSIARWATREASS